MRSPLYAQLTTIALLAREKKAAGIQRRNMGRLLAKTRRRRRCCIDVLYRLENKQADIANVAGRGVGSSL